MQTVTVLWEPRKSSFRYRFRSLERFNLAELLSDLDLLLFVQLVVHKEAIEARKNDCAQEKDIQCNPGYNHFRHYVYSGRHHLQTRFNFLVSSSRDPNVWYWSTYWQNHTALFFSRYRFRQPDLLWVLHAMGLYGKRIMVGKKGHYAYYPAEVGLSGPLGCSLSACISVPFFRSGARVWDQIKSTVRYISLHGGYHLRDVSQTHRIETWMPFADEFTNVFRQYGAPFGDLIGLLDGIFAATCRPGGLGNVHSREDQGETYSGHWTVRRGSMEWNLWQLTSPTEWWLPVVHSKARCTMAECFVSSGIWMEWDPTE